MTCIVGLVDNGKVWLGGDRASVDDHHYLTLSAHPKVFRNGPFLIGYTSSFRMGQLLEHSFAPPDLPTDVPFDAFMATTFVNEARACLKDGGYVKIIENREKSGTFLVGVAGRLYRVDEDFQAIRPEPGFDAVGCGVSVALGSMATSAHFRCGPRTRIEYALEAASQFTTGVRPPFDIIVEGGE
jgi:hypothetical protein